MANNIVIVKGRKLPPKATPSGRPPIYPWKEMDVGDCFKTNVISLRSSRTLASMAARRHAPKKFVARDVKGKSWIWRVA